MTPAFSASDLREALGELAAVLQQQGEPARIYVAGGAAMTLANKCDRLTRDIDAWVEQGHSPVIKNEGRMTLALPVELTLSRVSTPRLL